MTLKEYSIQLKGIIESIKLGDSISKKQIDYLYDKLDEFTRNIDIYIDTDYWPTPNSENKQVQNNSNTSSSDALDDLPF